MGLFSELRRRNVFRMAALYVGAAWLVMQVVDVLEGPLSLPDWTGVVVLTVLAVGLPIALILSWFYEVTPAGVTLDQGIDPGAGVKAAGRSLDFIVIAVLAAAVLMFAWDKWWTSGPSPQSIAVLPFANVSDDANNEYFSDGISEEILNLLVNVPDLLVISRTSAFSFKGKNVDIQTIANALNVAYILEGSVRRSGDQLRITAQLIKVESDKSLWSETYERELKNVFAVQDDIAAAVVDALKGSLIVDELKATTTDPKAYTYYLQARHLRRSGTSIGLQQAEALLQQALAIAPDFAPAWTELSHVYREQTTVYGLRSSAEGFELARHAVQRAQTLDPNFGPAYTALAQIQGQYDWNFESAIQNMEKAVLLSPNDSYALRIAAGASYMYGRLDEAIRLNKRAIALDPASSSVHWSLGRSSYAADRLEEAATSFQTALSLNPGAPKVRFQLGQTLLALGDLAGALAEMKLEPIAPYRLAGLAIVQHELGNTEVSNAALQELIDEQAETAAYQIAEVYAYRGEADNAFEWLERAYVNRDSGLPKLLPDPLLANLREDPRWVLLLEKLDLPHF